MGEFDLVFGEFIKHGGVLRTAELNEIGLSSRQIKRLVDNGIIRRIKHGFYEHSNYAPSEDVVIARLFPKAIIFLESALFHYGYTDRVPPAWQIAVDRNSEKSLYKLDYPLVQPFFLKPEYLTIGSDKYTVDGIDIRVFNRERTMCDVLRYENKLETEIFRNAISNYSKDPEMNLRRLVDYGKVFNISNKLQIYLGAWL